MSDSDNDNPIPEERFTPEPGGGDVAGGDATGGQPDEMPESPLTINGQYTKDLSFEAPGAPEIFNLLQQEIPNIQVDIDVQAEGKGENVFEVVLSVRAEAKAKEEIAYIAEISYAGLFTVNVPAEHMGPVLLIECPMILFPFLRRIIADATGDGGFAPLMLTPIDFASLYQQRMAQAQELAQTEAANDGKDGGALN